jgi:ribosomal protein S18 acetylase RimI-like enzyme
VSLDTQVTIREARGSDASRLTELIIELGHPIIEADVRRNLETLSAMSLLPLVATSGETVVGMCGLSEMVTIQRDAPVGRISILVVAEEHRGGGIGKLLVAEAQKRLAERGCKMVEVTSNQRRERAHGFYQALGYERTSYRFMKRLKL